MDVKNILYAEDNPDDSVILKMVFKRAGLPQPVSCVDDGEDAIEWISGTGKFADRQQCPFPDLLLLDLKMPRKSGFDVLEWLRRSEQFVHLPVVILSSSDDPRDIKRAAELGATKYFKKSASCSELIHYLKSTS
jgi:CheY-like chemotaxis protein